MLLTALLVMAVGQTAPLKVAAPRFSLVGTSPELAAVYQERFLSRLGGPDLSVVSERDIEQLIGLERQRQLMGCGADSTSCIAELAGALGVDVVISSSLAKTESGYIVTLRALRASDGKVLAAPNARVKNESALLDWLDETADALRITLLGDRAPMAARPPTWVPGVVGGVLLAGGAACFLVSGLQFARLNGDTAIPEDEISPVRQTGELLWPIGTALVAVGAVGIVASIIWGATWKPGPVQAAFAPMPGGGGVFALSGRFP